jgi:hypothetical protein
MAPGLHAKTDVHEGVDRRGKKHDPEAREGAIKGAGLKWKGRHVLMMELDHAVR